jgi:hypothetical protein
LDRITSLGAAAERITTLDGGFARSAGRGSAAAEITVVMEKALIWKD